MGRVGVFRSSFVSEVCLYFRLAFISCSSISWSESAVFAFSDSTGFINTSDNFMVLI